jgi:hypothetical protein
VVPGQVEVLLRHSAEGVQVEYTCVSLGRSIFDDAGVSKDTFLYNLMGIVSNMFPLLIDGLLAGIPLAPFSSAKSIGGKSLSLTHQNVEF